MNSPCEGVEPGCACHGWPVVVWVQGPATQEAAEEVVAAMLEAARPGAPAGTVVSVVFD